MKRLLLAIAKKLIISGIWLIEKSLGRRTNFTIIHTQGSTRFHFFQEPPQ